MNNQRNIIKIGFMFTITFLILSGCKRINIIDQLQIVTILGFSKEDDKYIGTALYTDYTEQKQGKVHTLQGEASTVELVLDDINSQSEKPIHIGKLMLLIVSEDIAKEDMSDIVKTICRDPLVGTNLIVAVSEIPPKEILNKIKEEGKGYLPALIEQNFISKNIPISNLHIFLFNYYGKGRDIAVPYLKLNQKGKVEINEYAVFKREKLGLILNEKEMVLYNILQDKSIGGQVAVNVRKDQFEDLAVLTILSGKIIESVSNPNTLPRISYNITLNGMVRDYPKWLDMRKKENNLLLDRQLEKRLKEDLKHLLLKFQEHNVDPLGVGDFIRAHSEEWNEEQFYETIYPTITFNVDINVVLSKSGIKQ
ncbi:Ger(x)C family spore germination protein [Virgibacillus oceani]|uniref:Germination protein GerC n=1 Tax=Virgibacillus oceani TaxID=1479511 RepID=A0A917M4V5_9BACI|nr:Ger(x)C family spore germination protein [Virgibacillus oceani]GGG77450.1 germination protein GerC [Virgibacillus oceani]